MQQSFAIRPERPRVVLAGLTIDQMTQGVEVIGDGMMDAGELL